jgi:hypothetical protein
MIEGIECCKRETADSQPGQVEGIEALFCPLPACPLPSEALYLGHTGIQDHLADPAVCLSVSICCVLSLVPARDVVVLLAEVVKEGRDDFVLADPAEGLQCDGGVSEEEVEEFLKEIGSNLVCLRVLFALGESVYLFG